jgi:hypothetical protein
MEAVTEVRSALPNASTITVDIAPLHEAAPQVEGAPRSRAGSDASAGAVQVVSTRNGDIMNTGNGKLYNMFKPKGDLDPDEKYAEKPKVKRDKNDNTEELQPTSFNVRPSFAPLIQDLISAYEASWTNEEFLLIILQSKPLKNIPRPPTVGGKREVVWNLKDQWFVQCLHCLDAVGAKAGQGLLFGDVGSLTNHFGSSTCVVTNRVKYEFKGSKKPSWQPIPLVATTSSKVEDGREYLTFK